MIQQSTWPDDALHEEIRREVFDQLLHADLSLLHLHVDDGVVTLRGQVERRSQADLAARLAAAHAGVTGVRNHLTYEVDDTRYDDMVRPGW